MECGTLRTVSVGRSSGVKDGGARESLSIVGVRVSV